MPKNGTKSKSPISDSESSSDSCTTDSVKMYMIQQKHHHKTKKSSKKHKSESESDEETPKKKCDKKPPKKHEDSSEDSTCSNKDKCTFDDIYKYYKHQLFLDDKLQVGGSDAYITSYNVNPDNISDCYPVNFSNNDQQLNIDHPLFNSPFCVRSSGIYILFFVTSSQQSCQFTLFINGIANTISTTGNNAGAGQTIFRQMYKLHKNDTLIIRNYQSSSTTLTLPLYVGGLLPGNSGTFLLMKIAALPCDEIKKIHWDPECLSRRKTYLFKKILEKMLIDPDFMLKGYTTHGTFWTKNTQNLLTETDVVYDSSSNVNNLSWSSTMPDKIKILEDGIYKVFFNCNTITSIQLCFTVNNVPIDSTIMGSNKGAGQTSIRSLIPLKKGDYLSVRNHTSSNGQVIISEHTGGSIQSITALLSIFKISPLTRYTMIDECKINSCYKKCYHKFKEYLFSQKCLQLTGTDTYFNYATTHSQTLQINDPLNLEITTLQENIYHNQSTPYLVIEKDGIYDIFVDCITSEPCQLTLFINDIPDLDTTTGRDSGANKLLLRQFVKLNRGDVVDVRNYSSNTVNLTTSINSGGSLPGIPVFFMGFKLADINDDCCVKPPKKNK
jgi:hypothetical protein